MIPFRCIFVSVLTMAQYVVVQGWFWCDNYDSEPWHADSDCPWIAKQGWFWQCTAYGKPACCQETKGSGSPYGMYEDDKCACDAVSRSCCDGHTRGRALRGEPDSVFDGEETRTTNFIVETGKILVNSGEMIDTAYTESNTAAADNVEEAHGDTLEEETAFFSPQQIDKFGRALSSASNNCDDPETTSCEDAVPSRWCRWYWLKCSDDFLYTWECKGWFCGFCHAGWHKTTMCKRSRSLYCNGGGNQKCRP